jgi:hypothetical protein
MPTRDEHCTHPDQAWCDCDWCRVVRAQDYKVLTDDKIAESE